MEISLKRVPLEDAGQCGRTPAAPYCARVHYYLFSDEGADTNLRLGTVVRV